MNLDRYGNVGKDKKFDSIEISGKHYILSGEIFDLLTDANFQIEELKKIVEKQTVTIRKQSSIMEAAGVEFN